MPYMCTEEDIKQFLEGVDVSKVKYETVKNRFSVYVQVPEYSVEKALLKSGNYIGERYVLVERCSERDLHCLQRQDEIEAECGELMYLKLCGLPFSVTKDDIRNFLQGIEVDSIILDEEQGRFMGNAFIKVPKDEVKNVLSRNKKHIGERYVIVMRCSFFEMDKLHRSHFGQSEHGDVPEGMTYVTLKGIPYKAGLNDIKDFIGVPTTEVLLGYGIDSRPSGIAYCLINVEDLPATLEKNNKYMNERYIRVYQTSQSEQDVQLRYTQNLN
ncbi:heterogeneous nuclear ribonucleoprotein F-like isoform X2 [Pecten maximus]|uniref:heterogeneous nuclear ribonucleoprotein F-like isoform X1 n=1 Tax=Pecten maximus TaxID=6579 RepID=UPI0014590008|nr:heterogeneous nuclear ribonucleoprotein F-like isoform X1 [Pecten maximus]XP_033743390.1 heterogeneous nuclear ribonucleoprotein F-like isoform X1 [Pecten maximus]XP_033743391.1 heterogeneous nuclear ribonucleoprotein F-like isoform X2 [Pecten maximus]XP_033743392.1 heterogeneous nuclear ribonucleoprotein F-like isoform X3 [Pecten maximus]XP_033743393.1 heterogeneous nuclear ribonucleoprotein F-like isoform X2 [Pecten maximus]